MHVRGAAPSMRPQGCSAARHRRDHPRHRPQGWQVRAHRSRRHPNADRGYRRHDQRRYAADRTRDRSIQRPLRVLPEEAAIGTLVECATTRKFNPASEAHNWLSSPSDKRARNSITALSYVYAAWGNLPVIVALFFGLKAAVLAIVVEALVRIGKRALKNQVMIALAAIAFVGIFFFNVPFPIIVFGAGLIGFAAASMGVTAFTTDAGHGVGKDKAGIIDDMLGEGIPEHARPTVARALAVSAIWLALWLVPVIALLATLGSANVFSQIAVFFSKMAVVTFGGAYAVLAYVAQQAVENYGWLKPGEMLDGLGMAETTPGPLIMVLQFVGFMAAFREPGSLAPMLAGTLGGLLATWVTFTPCFLWIFLGAPFIEVLRGNKALSGALSAITAAVVGVILNLAIWFGIHVLFRQVRPVEGFGLSFDAPVLTSVDPWALVLSGAAILAMFRFKVGMIPTLAACSAAGMVLYVTGAIS